MIKIPKVPSDEVRFAAARVTAKALIDDAEVEGELEDIAADVAKHCRYGDGFRMARDLERAHWDCDMRIAEVLDSHSSNLDDAHQRFLVDFQKQHGVQPPFPVGTTVNTQHGHGVIDGIYEHRPMTYRIKMSGDQKADSPTNRRTLLYFDEVEAA
ncbi:MAG: hypothetical protein JWO38_3319 [Gemmataceae bacterium]|nr:hypothetical protein [Gemmataceae bacterium]